MISLIGRGRLTLTTKALDDAGQRISRYLLAQLVVNGTFGVAVAVGLFFIGVPYAPLWGFLAAVLRYVPYLGPWLAAAFPLALAILITPGWTTPLLVVGLFLVLETASNLFMEPWLYGRNVGVSDAASIVAIAFWTWLWGPVGLILGLPSYGLSGGIGASRAVPEVPGYPSRVTVPRSSRTSAFINGCLRGRGRGVGHRRRAAGGILAGERLR